MSWIYQMHRGTTRRMRLHKQLRRSLSETADLVLNGLQIHNRKIIKRNQIRINQSINQSINQTNKQTKTNEPIKQISLIIKQNKKRNGNIESEALGSPRLR